MDGNQDDSFHVLSRMDSGLVGVREDCAAVKGQNSLARLTSNSVDSRSNGCIQKRTRGYQHCRSARTVSGEGEGLGEITTM